MVKQTKNYKKGCVSKKALSAILAASMVMTSSSFVMAAPVVEDVAVESEGVAEVQAIDVEEETVGEVLAGCTAEAQDCTYNGQAQTPAVTVKDSNNKVISKDYYTVTYKDNTNVGTASYTVKFKGQYEGTADIEGTFAINPLNLTRDNTKIVFKANTGIFYTGEVQIPEASVQVTLNDGNVITLPATDYELIATGIDGQPGQYYDLISAGSQRVKVTAKTGNIALIDNAWIPSETYTIDPSDFNENTVSVVSRSVAFNFGRPVDADLVVKNTTTNNELTTADYTIQYYNAKGEKTDTAPSDIGTYKLVLTGQGNYREDSIETTLTIVSALSLQEEVDQIMTMIGDDLDLTYNFQEQGYDKTKFERIIKELSSIVEFDFSEAKGTEVGTYYIKLKGLNIYDGQTATIPFKIVPKYLDKTDSAFEYTATLGTSHSGVTAKNAVVTLKYKVDDDTTVTLEEGKDYTYTTDTTKGVVVITGLGNFTSVNPNNSKETTVEFKYDENKKGLYLSDPAITATVNGDYSYTGYSITPSIDKIVVVENDTTPYTLKAGQDFKIAGYGTNTNAGEGTIVIEGIGNYEGTRTITFKISGAAISDTYKIADIADINLDDIVSGQKNGKAAVKVVRIDNGATAPSSVWDSNSVKYYKNGKLANDSAFKEAGTIEVEVKAKGQYEGTLKTSYTIVGKDIAKSGKIEAIADQNYTGKAIQPTVKVTYAGKVLEEGKDYTVAYDHNTEVGTAYVTATGTGEYSGQITTSFKIVGTDMSAAVATASDVVYTGEAQTPEITVKLGDTTLTANDYTVEYKDNTNVGTASFTVTGKGGYTGTVEGTFAIAKADQVLSIPDFQVTALKGRNTNANEYTLKVSGALEGLTFTSSNESVATVKADGQILFKHKVGEATITVNAAGSDNANAGKLEVAVKVIPATPTVKVAAANDAFKVTASKVKDAGGYQVAYATKADFSNQTKKAFNTTAKLSKTIKAKNKTSYNVKVRAYKKVNGKYVFGKWSAVKTVKTK